MTRIVLAAALAAVLPSTAAAQWRANQLTIAEPALVATIDDIKGEPSRLAWSADGTELYFQTVEGPFSKPTKVRHYVISAADGKTRDVDAEPAWADAYWKLKYGPNSPDDPSFKIEIKSEPKKARTTSVPMGGDLARGGTAGGSGTSSGGGTSDDDAAAAARNGQTVYVNSLILKGETIGVFDNATIVPGLTFGWGPKGSSVIAFAAKNGRIVAMDASGGKKEVSSSKNAVLPAWSADGSKLAWLQKDGKKKVVLQVSRVSAS